MSDVIDFEKKSAELTRRLAKESFYEEEPRQRATYLDSDELILNMGPQHPSTHGVLRVLLKLDGEKVIGTECIIGYLHRGVEKIAENRTYAMFNPNGLRGSGLQRPRLLRNHRKVAEY
jgi:hypothetical protein